MNNFKATISPSSLYSFFECDGLAVSKMVLPSLKSNAKFLIRGKLVHHYLEHWDNTEKDRLKDIVAEDPEMLVMVKNAKTRFYSDKIVAKEMSLSMESPFGFETFDLLGSIDCIAIDGNNIIIIDYKTSRMKSRKDTIQLMCYLYMVKQTGFYKQFGLDNPTIYGIVDYINPLVDEMVYVRLSELDLAEFENDLYINIRRFDKIIDSILKNEDPGHIEYRSGPHCNYCPLQGNCVLHKMAVDNSDILLDKPKKRKSEAELLEEYNQLKSLQMSVNSRIDAIKNSAKLKKALDSGYDYKSRVKTTTDIKSEFLIKNLKEAYGETISTDLLKILLQENNLKINKKSLESLPPEIRNLIENSKSERLSEEIMF